MAPFARIQCRAALVSSPPEKAMPTRSPTGTLCRMLLTAEIVSELQPEDQSLVGARRALERLPIGALDRDAAALAADFEPALRVARKRVPGLAHPLLQPGRAPVLAPLLHPARGEEELGLGSGQARRVPD